MAVRMPFLSILNLSFFVTLRMTILNPNDSNKLKLQVQQVIQTSLNLEARTGSVVSFLIFAEAIRIRSARCSKEISQELHRHYSKYRGQLFGQISPITYGKPGPSRVTKQ